MELTDTDKNRAVVALLVFADDCASSSECLQLDVLDSAHRIACHFGIDIGELTPAVQQLLKQRN